MELDQSHFASLFQNTTEGLIITNSDGGIVFIIVPTYVSVGLLY